MKLKEIEFNNENAIKVVTELANGLVNESAKNVLMSNIKGEDINTFLYGMAQVSSLFVDIFTNADEFHGAIKFLAEHGVTIE